VQQSEILRRQLANQGVDAGDVAARAVEAGDESGPHRVGAGIEHDRNVRGPQLPPGRVVSGAPGASEDNDGNAPKDQIRRQCEGHGRTYASLG
jgi:hypothetical protein